MRMVDAAKVVTELERIEYVEDPQSGQGLLLRGGDAPGRRGVQCAGLRRHQALPPHRARERGRTPSAGRTTRPSRRCRRGRHGVYGRDILSGGVAAAVHLHGPQRQTPLCCCWMRSPPVWMPRRRPVYGRPCVRPPVGAPSSPFPTASMRVLAAGLWRSGPRDSKYWERSPGGRKTSGAAKCWGKKRLTASMGSVMMNRGRRDLFQPSTEVNVHG